MIKKNEIREVELGSHHEFTHEECERLLRLLRWVDSACQGTEQDRKFLSKIQYKLRSRLKQE